MGQQFLTKWEICCPYLIIGELERMIRVKRMKKYIVLVSLIGLFLISACGTTKMEVGSNKGLVMQNAENVVEEVIEQAEEMQMMENDEELAREKEEHYKNLVSNATDEVVIRISIDDFDMDGSEEAFLLTTSKENYDFVMTKEDIYGMGFDISANVWFAKEEKCYLIESFVDFLYSEQCWMVGLLSENQKYVRVESWLSNYDRKHTFYSLENGEAKMIFWGANVTIDENGTITTRTTDRKSHV